MPIDLEEVRRLAEAELRRRAARRAGTASADDAEVLPPELAGLALLVSGVPEPLRDEVRRAVAWQMKYVLEANGHPVPAWLRDELSSP